MQDFIPTTTILACPTCATPARLAQGEDETRCQACNAVVRRDGRGGGSGGGSGDRQDREDAWQRIVLVAGAVILCAGIAAWAIGRRPPPSRGPAATEAAKAQSQHPPPLTAPPSMPAGELAWIGEARGPTLVSLDGDGVEDVFGFFRVWDGRSAWTTFAGAFRGSTLAPLWRTEPLDPWLLRKAGIVPMTVALGKRLVVADATATLRIYELSGEKQATYNLGQAPRNLCAAGDGIHVWVDADPPSLLDVETGKLTASPSPPPACSRAAGKAKTDRRDGGTDAASASAAGECDSYFQNPFARASCQPASQLPAVAGIDLQYAVLDGAIWIGVGTTSEPGTRKVPTVAAFGGGGSGKVAWQRPIAADTSTLATESPPRLAEIANGQVYLIYGKAYFAGRLEAIDAKTGQTSWDVPVVGSLPRPDAFGERGDATSLVVSGSRVYVARSGGGLDVFDAKTGTAIGTIGNGQK